MYDDNDDDDGPREQLPNRPSSAMARGGGPISPRPASGASAGPVPPLPVEALHPMEAPDDEEVQGGYRGDGQDGIFGAVLDGDTARVAEALCGTPRNSDLLDRQYAGERQRTALHAAVMLRNEEAVRLIMDAGASVGETVDDDDETPLTLAIAYMPSVLPAMIERGRRRNLRRVDKAGQNILHRVVTKGGGGGPLKINGRAAVRHRAAWDRLQVVRKLLVEDGSLVAQRDARGFSPAEWARENYLSLGPNADEIITLLEQPPTFVGAGNSGAVEGSVLTGNPLVRTVAFVLTHPATRILVLLGLALLHVLIYASDTTDRRYAVAVGPADDADATPAPLLATAAAVVGTDLLAPRGEWAAALQVLAARAANTSTFAEVAAAVPAVWSADVQQLLGRLAAATSGPARLGPTAVPANLFMTAFCDSGLASAQAQPIRQLAVFHVIFSVIDLVGFGWSAPPDEARRNALPANEHRQQAATAFPAPNVAAAIGSRAACIVVGAAAGLAATMVLHLLVLRRLLLLRIFGAHTNAIVTRGLRPLALFGVIGGIFLGGLAHNAILMDAIAASAPEAATLWAARRLVASDYVQNIATATAQDAAAGDTNGTRTGTAVADAWRNASLLPAGRSPVLVDGAQYYDDYDALRDLSMKPCLPDVPPHTALKGLFITALVLDALLLWGAVDTMHQSAALRAFLPAARGHTTALFDWLNALPTRGAGRIVIFWLALAASLAVIGSTSIYFGDSLLAGAPTRPPSGSGVVSGGRWPAEERLSEDVLLETARTERGMYVPLYTVADPVRRAAMSAAAVLLAVVAMAQDWSLPKLASHRGVFLPGTRYVTSTGWWLWGLATCSVIIDVRRLAAQVADLPRQPLGLVGALACAAAAAVLFLGVLWVASLRCKCWWADPRFTEVEELLEEPEAGGPGEDDAARDDASDDGRRSRDLARLESRAAGAFSAIRRIARVRDVLLGDTQRSGRAPTNRGNGPAFERIDLHDDVWHCAYTDDAVRMCSILEQRPDLLDARGGFGLVCSARHSTATYCYDFDSGARGFNSTAFKPLVAQAGKAQGPNAITMRVLQDARDRAAAAAAAAFRAKRGGERKEAKGGDAAEGPAPGSSKDSPPPVVVATGPLADDAELVAIAQRSALPIPQHPFGATPLHYAIAGNARSTLASLVNRGANTHLRTTHGLLSCGDLARLVGCAQYLDMVGDA